MSFYIEYYRWLNLFIILCFSLLMKDFTCLCSDNVQDPMLSLHQVDLSDSVKPKTDWSTGFNLNVWSSESMKDCVWYQMAYKVCGVKVTGTLPEMLCDTNTLKLSTTAPVGFVEETRLKELAKRASLSK